MTGNAPLRTPVRVLSDLHLGHDLGTVRQTAHLRALLDGAATVVFNGDTIESRSPVFRSRSLDQLGELKELCVKAGAEAVFLNGNHDPDDWPQDWLELGNGALFITHGHVFQRLISPWSSKMRHHRPGLERILSEYPEDAWHDMEKRFAIARRLCLSLPPSETRQKNTSSAARTALFLREMWPPNRPLAVLRVWAALPATVSDFVGEFRPRARAVLFGHTHRAACWRRGERLLVNTGAFVTFAAASIAEWDGSTLAVRRIRRSADGSCRIGRTMAVRSLPPADQK